MEAVPASTSCGLCGCLRKIAGLLEQGNTVGAAGVVAEMNALIPTLPTEISESEAAEAKALLKRCANLERGLHERALVAMQQLGAARKSRVYRRIAWRP